MEVYDSLPPKIREICNRTSVDYLTLRWRLDMGCDEESVLRNALEMEQRVLEAERLFIEKSLE